ncbi:hypothetical protein NBRC116188_13380 [Oceaniserpentilla sp. 4NH20-0058]|uniref:hypothetical protein n=1 Tax=Oceaniserpentilla sp. 4NH20-0058 TaxID=3127660 RepID=UPI0031038068
MKSIGILLCLVSTLAFGDTLKAPKDARVLADKMVKSFVKTEFKEGLDLAKPYWPLNQVEVDGLANQISTQWPLVDQRFGKSTGYEFVQEERIGNSFIRYYYVHKFQNHAIYWQLTFYKPEDSWLVNGVTFKDNLDILFQVVE